MMGKPKGKKTSSGSSFSLREPKASSPSLSGATTAESMVEKIHAYLESCEFGLAEKFADRGIERFPDNPQILEAAGQCYTEVGHIQKARSCYEKAISKSSLHGWRKYLGLAQLLDGKDALLQYTRGIEVMERDIATRSETTKKPSGDGDAHIARSANEHGEGPSAESASSKDVVTSRDLSNAYLSISELYTTDLCDDDNAEDMCKYAIEKAMLSDPKNPDAFQQMANLYLIRGEKADALQYVKGGLSLWYQDGHSQPTTSKAAEEAANNKIGVDYEEGESIPPLAFQIDTAKSLIECEEYELAGRLFSEFIGQAPDDPELWLLSGLAHFHHGQEFYPQARSDFKKAKKLSTTPHGICHDIIAQCDEYLKTIAEGLPDNNDDSDDEEPQDASQRKNSASCSDSALTGKVSLNPELNAGDGEDSDWETDEEQDVEMN